MSENTIGRYIIESVLGEGAMGRVYKGYDPNLDRHVAIKTMRMINLSKEEERKEFKERFLVESRVTGGLNHPNIVGVYDFGVHEQEPFLVMEYVNGKPLDHYVSQHFSNGMSSLLAILDQIAAGLDYAHEETIIHRDIKPGNILITTTRSGRLRAKIADFGLAKLQDSTMTQTGSFLGTPSYASPEQIINGRVDTRSDIYSFGTMVYEILTAKLPFIAESLHSILYNIANAPPVINFDHFKGYLDAAALDRVFQQILSKNPDERHQSASEFVLDLKKVIKEPEALKRPSKTASKQAKKVEKVAKASSSAIEETVLTSQGPSSKMRSLFQQAYESRNLSSVQYCLKELIEMGVDVHKEKVLLQKLEEELQEEYKKNFHKQIVKIEEAFQLALASRNIQSCRFCIQELQELDADTSVQEKALANLKHELEQEEEKLKIEAKRRKDINKIRKMFTQAIAAEDEEGASGYLQRLIELEAHVLVEQNNYSDLLQRKQASQEQRDSWIFKVRTQFQEAVVQKDLERCRKLFIELDALLKVDSHQEQKMLTQLESQMMEEESLSFTKGIVASLRTSFNKALAAKNLKECKSHLNNLKEHHADTKNEERAFRQLRKQLDEEEKALFKRQLIQKTQDKFEKAFRQKKIERCQYYLQELKQLTSATASEEAKLTQLQSNNSEEERFRQTLIKGLMDKFQHALRDQKVEKCHYYLKELEQLQVDVTMELKQLKDLETQWKQQDSNQRSAIVEQCRFDFLVALRNQNIEECEFYLERLRALSAGVTSEEAELNKLKEKRG